MWLWLSALSFALASYIVLSSSVKGLTPEEKLEKKAKKKAKQALQAQRGHHVTLQSLKIMDIPYTRFRLLSLLWGFLIAAAWWYICQSTGAAIVMFFVGLQLPGLWYEQRASGKLDNLGSQTAFFVGTTADGLSSGRTISDALKGAALLMREEPMASIAKTYLSKVDAKVPITVAIMDMAKQINTASFLFFADLVATVKIAGGNGGESFRILDYTFHEEEDLQGDMRGEVSLWMTLLLFFLAVTLTGPFFYRYALPDIWPYIIRNYWWVPFGSSFGTLIIFSGLRWYSRYRVTI